MSRLSRKTKRRPTAPAIERPSLGNIWHAIWVLCLLVGFLVVMNIYYDDLALDTSFIPRLRALYATLLVALPLLLLPDSARRLDWTVLRDPLLLSFGLFALTSFATLGLALNPTAGFTDAFRNFGIWVWLCLLCLLLPTLPDWKERLLQIIVCGSTVSVAWGCYEMISLYGFGLHSRTLMTNVTGTMANVNLYAGFLTLLFPFTLCAAAVLRGWWRPLSLMVALATMMMVALLQTRAAYLGLAGSVILAVGLAVPFGRSLGLGRRVRWALAGGLLLVAVALAAFLMVAPDTNPVATRLRSLGAAMQDASGGARLMAWKITLQMIADHFPLGVGTGNFTMRLDEYFNAQTDFSGEGTNWIYPHNDYLWVLVEQGLAGSLAFAGFFFFAGVYSFNVLRRSKSVVSARLALVVLMVLVAYLIDSFFGFPLARVSHQIYLAVALALAILLAREMRSEAAASEPAAGASYPRKMLLIALPVLAVLAVGFTYARAAMKQELYLATVFALEAEGMWPAALRVVRALETPWKTTDYAATPIAYHEARILKEIGTPHQTLEALERAYRQNPNRIYVINDLGSYYAKAGRFDEAIALLTKTVERYPNQIACVENLALCYMDQGDYGKALEILNGIAEDKRTETIREKIARCREELNLSDRGDRVQP